ncbi:MAG TPA: flippase [Bacteroidota bacterium]
MKRLVKNFLSLASSEIVRKILGFLAVAYLARRLSLADFGLVSLGFTILAYTINISTAGLSVFGIKATARGDEKAVVGKLLSLRLLIAGAVFVLSAVGTVLIVKDPVAARLIVVFSCALFAHALLLDWFYQGREAMNTVSVGKCVTAAVNLILLLVLVRSDLDILLVGAAAVAGDFVMMLFYVVKYRREGNELHLVADPPAWRHMLGQSLPLGAGTVLGQISINLAPLVLAVLMTNVEVGLYSAASKLVMFLLIIDRVLGILLLPATARLQAASPEQLRLRLGEALKWIVLAALPLSVGGMLLSGDVIRLVFGPNFSEASGVFRILVWFLSLTMIHTVFTSGLLAVAPGDVYGKVMGRSAVIYFILVVVLTRAYGLFGTAFAVVASEGLTLLIARAKLRPYLDIRTNIPVLWILVALAAMSVAVLALPSVNIIVRVLTGAGVYCSILLLVRVLSFNDVATLVWRKSS